MSFNQYGRYAKKLALELCAMPLYLLSFFVSRDPNLWVFGEWHGSGYRDNSKYLFEYINSVEKNRIQTVWLTKNRADFTSFDMAGSRYQYAYSVRGWWTCMRAGFALVTHSASDVNQFALGGCVLVNLTHGVPLKRLGKDANFKRLGILTTFFDRYVSSFLPSSKRYNYIFCADEISASRFKSAYDVLSEVKSFGYPRWHGLFRESENKNKLQIKSKRFSKIVCYAPTLRFNNHVQFDPFLLPGYCRFISFIEENNILLLIRPHPVVTLRADLSCSDNVAIVHNSEIPDVADLLAVTDLLVTDFSSIMFDFNLLGRPIVLFAPDVESYIADDVGVYGDYVADALGPITYTWLQLATTIEAIFETSCSTRSLIKADKGLESSENIVKYLLERG